ncbi:thioredoxin family protein [Paenibacillus mendelii]|uniref:Thioredoxin family protein n=1 Tax=Paenibacillus mendelii TaxID=206163 RepID=A0ABV6JB56_9BACL|nr:thioredoxin family protein [Paenibacillus mendelii]MCQ6563004.1 thioredoxin family protein [Paenibacillus mendelii]
MKKKSKMNKPIIFIGIIVVLFALIFVLNNSNKNALYGKSSSDLNPATRELLDDPNYQNIILPGDLADMKKNKEDFFVYFFSSDCSHCRFTTPQLTPLVKELGVDMKMFNLLEFREYFGKENIEFTPTLVYFKDGVQAERLVGGLKEEGTDSGYSLDDFKAFFEKYKTSEGGSAK